MKLKMKKISGILLAMLLVISLVGCGENKQSDSSENSESEGQETSSVFDESETSELSSELMGSESSSEYIGEESTVSEFPITITDHRGQEVIIDSKPEKIVSGYYVSSSILIALELKDEVVGIESKADTRPIYALAAPEFLALPQVGTAKEFNLEACMALEPELVVLPIKLKETAKTLEELGIKVICINPENQALLEEAITMVGIATDTQERAEEMITYANEAITLSQGAIDAKDKSSVYLAGNSDLLNTSGKKMYQNTLINQAGGVNVAEDFEDAYWAKISYEQLLAFNPDYIILAPFANYTKDSVLTDKNLSSMEAIANEKVFQMPNNIEAWDSPIPSSFLGSLWITATLYPEVYSYDEFEIQVKDFYEKFYGFSVDTITVVE